MTAVIVPGGTGGLSGCAQLKLATHGVHEALHRAPGLHAFERGALDVAGYLEVMHTFNRFYSELDRLVLDAMPLLDVYCTTLHYVPRAPLFARDIADLQAAGRASGATSREYSLHGKSLGSASAVAGALYVVEGSILGGASLNHAAGKILQTTEIKGRSYWHWCRENASERWRQTRALVDEVWLKEAQGRELLETAAWVFEELLACFDGEMAERAAPEAAQ